MRTLFTIPIILLLTLLSCDSQQAIDKKIKSKVFAREPNDSADYKHLKYNFYLSKTRQLCERKLAMAKDTLCNCLFEVYYDSNFSIFTGDTTVRKPLSSLVDISSFIQLDSTEYSKDKNQVYYFYDNSDGGNRNVVLGADPKSFKRLCEYRWGIDKKAVYYQNRKLEGLELSKLQILRSPDTSDHFVEYIKDDKIVYCGDAALKGADAKTFKVLSGQKWQAEDKNRKYGQRM